MPRKQPFEAKYVSDEATDSTRRLDLSKMRRASFPELKPSSATISLRMPVWMLLEIKRLANQRDVPYQSYIKMIVADGIKKKVSR
jgi:predicted DNA binding CopG/RHH family protein